MRRTAIAGVFILSCLLSGKLAQEFPEEQLAQESRQQLTLNQEEARSLAGGDVGGVICRACNLSIPFHGCLLDFGTCRAKPGQFCIKESLSKGGIQWYSVKGCTEDKSECFKRTVRNYETRVSHCCHRPLCNF